MKDEFVKAILPSTDGVLSLPTPPSPEEKYLRSSTLPNLCQAVVKNERYYDEFSIFEEAQVFDGTRFTSPYDESEKLPVQKRHIGCAFASKTDKLEGITLLFRQAKGILAEMPRYTHMEPFSFAKNEKPLWADNVAWLNIYVGETKVGNMGLLSKKASMACGIKNLSVVLAEIDTDLLIPYRSRTNVFAHLPEYPMNDYDISMLVDTTVSWEDIRRTVLSKHNPLLHGVSFVDEYKGKQIPEGKKSVTVRIVIGAEDRTLTSEEIETCANGTIKNLTKNLGAEIRGK